VILQSYKKCVKSQINLPAPTYNRFKRCGTALLCLKFPAAEPAARCDSEEPLLWHLALLMLSGVSAKEAGAAAFPLLILL